MGVTVWLYGWHTVKPWSVGSLEPFEGVPSVVWSTPEYLFGLWTQIEMTGEGVFEHVQTFSVSIKTPIESWQNNLLYRTWLYIPWDVWDYLIIKIWLTRTTVFPKEEYIIFKKRGMELIDTRLKHSFARWRFLSILLQGYYNSSTFFQKLLTSSYWGHGKSSLSFLVRLILWPDRWTLRQYNYIFHRLSLQERKDRPLWGIVYESLNCQTQRSGLEGLVGKGNLIFSLGFLLPSLLV